MKINYPLIAVVLFVLLFWLGLLWVFLGFEIAFIACKAFVPILIVSWLFARVPEHVRYVRR